MKNISVLLADDHTVVRQGLRALLSSEQGMLVVGEAENGWQTLQVAKQTQPDIVVMDLAMPLLDGVETARRIRRELPAAKVLVLTTYTDDETVRRVIEAGVAGYVTKQTAAEELITAIREVGKGNAFFSPAIARRLCEQSRRLSARRRGYARPDSLSRREAQVLRWVSRGLANKQIAAELGISTKTVEKHRQHLMKKLGIYGIAGLTRYAFAKGLLKQ